MNKITNAWIVVMGLSVAVAMTMSCVAQTSDHVISFPHKFHVQGNKILDESGNEIVFRGLDVSTTTDLVKLELKLSFLKCLR